MIPNPDTAITHEGEPDLHDQEAIEIAESLLTDIDRRVEPLNSDTTTRALFYLWSMIMWAFISAGRQDDIERELASAIAHYKEKSDARDDEQQGSGCVSSASADGSTGT